MGFTFELLYYIYLRFDLGVVVRLLLVSAAYRLVWMRVLLSVAGLSPSPSDVSKLWSSGEPSLKKSRLRERTVTQWSAQRSTQNKPFHLSCGLLIIRFHSLTGPEAAVFFISFDQTCHFIPGPLIQQNYLCLYRLSDTFTQEKENVLTENM